METMERSHTGAADDAALPNIGAAAAAPTRLDEEAAVAFGGQLQGLAVANSRMEHEFCRLVVAFDQGEAIGWYRGLKSTAHFLAWACEMTPSVAREHVRVARALQRMPVTDAAFADGRLSYSKVREITRLLRECDEAALAHLAEEMTASQLARTVSSYRTCAGTRLAAEGKRKFTIAPRGDGMVHLTVCLPAEDAALLSAAVEAATHRSQPPREGTENVPAGTPPGIDQVQALVDIAASYLDTLPGEPTDDHTVVMVHVNAALLGDVPAGTSFEPPDAPACPTAEATLRDGTCFVEGHGPIESATAQRLARTSRLVAALIDDHGDVLALGRTTRLASRAQRRALRVREHGVCQFPGCHQTRHVEAHHRRPWLAGGRTDLDNLMLLCRAHHTAVHEGGITIHVCDQPGPDGRPRYRFVLPDGRPVSDTWATTGTLDDLAWLIPLDGATDGAPTTTDKARGEGFSLHECVNVLFGVQLERDRAA